MGLEQKRKGFVVVVVLCTVMLMSVLLLGFNSRCRRALRTADEFRKSRQALNCARAGLNIAIAALRSGADRSSDGTFAGPVGGRHSFDADAGTCVVTVIDESGKLNVNLLKDRTGQLDRARVNQVLRLIDVVNRGRAVRGKISYGLVPAMIDWIDKDEEVTLLPFVRSDNRGAESLYYTGLANPYGCSNSPLDTTDELILVKGVTPEVFEGIRDYVTVYGEGRININSAPPRVIESLAEQMDSVLARMIIKRRKIKPFESIAEIKDVPGMTESIYNSIKGLISVGPAGNEQYYNVLAEGEVDEVIRTVSAVLRRNVRSKTVDVVLYKEL